MKQSIRGGLARSVSAVALLLASGSCRSVSTVEIERQWDEQHKTSIPYSRTRPLYPASWTDAGRALPDETPGLLQVKVAFSKRLQEPISFNFDKMQLNDAIFIMCRLMHVGMAVNWKGIPYRGHMLVTAKFDNVPCGEAFRQVLSSVDLDYSSRRNSGLYVTAPEKLVAWYYSPTVHYSPEEWKPVESVMRRRVSFDFRGNPVETVMARLEKATGVPIDYPDWAGKLKGSSDVDLKVTDMELRYVIAWVCYDLDLVYTVKGGRIIMEDPVTLAVWENSGFPNPTPPDR